MAGFLLEVYRHTVAPLLLCLTKEVAGVLLQQLGQGQVDVQQGLLLVVLTVLLLLRLLKLVLLVVVECPRRCLFLLVCCYPLLMLLMLQLLQLVQLLQLRKLCLKLGS